MFEGSGLGLYRGEGKSRRWKSKCLGFPGGAVVESLPANAGDTGSSPGLVWEDPTCRGAIRPVSHNY